MDFDFNQAKGPQLRVIREGLRETYRRRSLAMLLMDEFDRDYDALVERGSFDEELFELVLTAKREGWLNEFVKATVKAYPNAPAMRTVLETFALLESAGTSPPPALAPSGDQEEDAPLEQLIQRSAPSFSSPLHWGERLNAMRGRVCKIDVGDAKATGCLIGPDLVMTCDYVLQRAAPEAAMSARFDYIVDQGIAHEGRSCRFAEDWLVLRQPFEPPEDGGASLDSRIVRLAERVGDDLLTNNERRGWIDVPTSSSIKIGEPVFMLHHPQAGPLMMSTGRVLAWDENDSRFATDSATAPGSGGAPVLDAKFKLIGLHESASRQKGTQAHRGEIRADLIGKELRKGGVVSEGGDL